MEQTPLRKIRLERGLSLEIVARAIGLDTGNLSRVERAEQGISLEKAELLVGFFDGEITELEILYPQRYMQGAQVA